MQIVKLRKVGNEMIVALPSEAVNVLHLHEDDDIAMEVVGDRIILTHPTSEVQEAWDAYKGIEPYYRNANRKLAE